MRWVSIECGTEIKPGLLVGDEVKLLPHGQLVDWLGDLPVARSKAGDGGIVPFDPKTLAAPIPKPGKILGIGLNYAAHVKESVSFISNDTPQVQKWFNKQATAANRPYGSVDLPAVSEQLDYEAELVVIIGKRGRHVPHDRAMELVAGYACGCDYSVRDWQKASPTMIMGKGFDSHAPFGPALVTPDEAGALSEMRIKCFVNGEQRQDAVASDMTFSISQQIAHLTAAFTLEPGDIIFTGTPAGVGAGYKPPKWLKAGDTVKVDIDGIGRIEHDIVRESGETFIG